jgi:hypothetical protein
MSIGTCGLKWHLSVFSSPILGFSVLLMVCATCSQIKCGTSSDTSPAAPRPTSAHSGSQAFSDRLVWLRCLAVATGVGSVVRERCGLADAKRVSTAGANKAIVTLLLDRRIVLVRGWSVTSFTSGSVAAFLPVCTSVRTCARCAFCSAVQLLHDNEPAMILFMDILCTTISLHARRRVEALWSF